MLKTAAESMKTYFKAELGKTREHATNIFLLKIRYFKAQRNYYYYETKHYEMQVNITKTPQIH